MSMTIARVAAGLLLLAVSCDMRSGDKRGHPGPAIVDGLYLNAFSIAHSNFVKIADLPLDKKDLTRYTVRFSINGPHVVVVFVPKFPPNWFGSGGETPYGREVSYTIDLKTKRIVQRQYGE